MLSDPEAGARKQKPVSSKSVIASLCRWCCPKVRSAEDRSGNLKRIVMSPTSCLRPKCREGSSSSCEACGRSGPHVQDLQISSRVTTPAEATYKRSKLPQPSLHHGLQRQSLGRSPSDSKKLCRCEKGSGSSLVGGWQIRISGDSIQVLFLQTAYSQTNV